MSTHTIDATGKKLGRLASRIAVILQGKENPEYEPRVSGAESVIIKNVEKIEISGEKYTDKKYYSHTGQIGHLKVRTYKQKFEKDPGWALRHAVRLMLPKNKLAKDRMKRLII